LAILCAWIFCAAISISNQLMNSYYSAPRARVLAAFLWKGILALALGSAVLSAQPAGGNPLPDQLLVKARPNMNEAAIQNLLGSLGGQEIDRIQQIQVRIVRVPERVRDRVLDALQRNPNIEFAEADELVAPGFTPNDPYYKNQWHLPKIEAPKAWDVTTGSGSVIVAILDTGVDPKHSDLAALLVPGWNFYDNNPDTADVYGHGTAVAGSAVAIGNNSSGIASVSWNCRIMPIRISSTTGGATFSAMAKGLTFAADNGARVGNISYNAASRSSTVQSAAKYFQEKAAGVVTISSGNDGLYIESPDSIYVLAVGATGSTDALTSFSNKGPYVDLVAPGSSIYTTANGGGYRSASGTSFSAPIVAGVAALVISVNPSLTALQVQDILMQTADDLGTAGYDTSYGHGRVNASKAVMAATSFKQAPALDTTPPTVVIGSPDPGSTVAGLVTVDIAATDNTGVSQIELYLDNELVAVQSGAQLSVLWDTTAQPDGASTATAVAYDKAGNRAAAASTVTVRNKSDVTPPFVVITSPSNGAILAKSQKITVKASDESGVTRVELYANRVLIGSSAGNSTGNYSFTWNTSKVSKGTYLLEAFARDAAGNVGVSPGITVVK
jgi:thermitase